MTDFHKSVNIGNHFPAGYKDQLFQAARSEFLSSQAAGFATSPHRLRIQTDKRPTDFLRNIIRLHDSGCILTTVEALSMEWRSPRLYIVGAECLFRSEMGCSTRSMMFLLRIMMHNVSRCGAVYRCCVNTGAIMSPALFLSLDEQRWLYPGRIFKRPAFQERVCICPGWCRPHPHGFARFCSGFTRLDHFLLVVMYLCLSQLILSPQAHSFYLRSSALWLHHFLHSAVQKKKKTKNNLSHLVKTKGGILLLPVPHGGCEANLWWEDLFTADGNLLPPTVVAHSTPHTSHFSRS